MSKKYKNYINNLFEADSSTPQFGPKRGESKGAKQTGKGFMGVPDDIKSKVKSVITDVIKRLPDRAYRDLKDEKSIDIISNMTNKAIAKIEFDDQGNPVSVRTKDGLGVLSSNFQKLDNPLYQSLYLLIANAFSGEDFGYNDEIPFSILKGILQTGDTIAEIGSMTDDELNSSIARPPKLAPIMDALLKNARENPEFDDKTIIGMSVGETKVAPTGHGRLNKLVQTLQDIDREYFEKNRNFSGQNYGGVKDTNEAIEKFVNGMVTMKTKTSALKSGVDKLKNEYLNNKKQIMADVGVRFNNIEQKVYRDIVDQVDVKIKSMKDKDKVLSTIVGAIESAKTQKMKKALQAHYKWRKELKRLESEVETPVEPNLMISIIDKIFEVDAEAVHAPQLNTFIETNYSQYPQVVEHYYKMLKKAGASDNEPIEIDRDTAGDIGREIDVPVPMESFLDKMVNVINEGKDD